MLVERREPDRGEVGEMIDDLYIIDQYLVS